jgi:beta-aspartyl-peptidase (threonine type)
MNASTRLLAASFLILAGSLTGCAGTVSSYRDRDQSEAMESVLRSQEAAWNRGDLDLFLAEGYLRSTALTFFSGGDVSRGFETVLDHYRKSYKEGGKEMGHLTFSDVETVLFGPDGGIVRGRWRLEFLNKSETGGLFTLAMQRTNQGWRIVHDHTSVGEKAPTGEKR